MAEQTDSQLVELCYNALEDSIDYSNDKLYGAMLFLGAYVNDNSISTVLNEFIQNSDVEIEVNAK